MPENKEAVQNVELKFEKMMDEAMKQKPVKTEEALVTKIIKDIKRGKARDSHTYIHT